MKGYQLKSTYPTPEHCKFKLLTRALVDRGPGREFPFLLLTLYATRRMGLM